MNKISKHLPYVCCVNCIFSYERADTETRWCLYNPEEYQKLDSDFCSQFIEKDTLRNFNELLINKKEGTVSGPKTVLDLVKDIKRTIDEELSCSDVGQRFVDFTFYGPRYNDKVLEIVSNCYLEMGWKDIKFSRVKASHYTKAHLNRVVLERDVDQVLSHQEEEEFNAKKDDKDE